VQVRIKTVSKFWRSSKNSSKRRGKYWLRKMKVNTTTPVPLSRKSKRYLKIRIEVS
jgi:hypothetical protein